MYKYIDNSDKHKMIHIPFKTILFAYYSKYFNQKKYIRMKQTQAKIIHTQGTISIILRPVTARPMTTLTLGYDKRRLCIRYVHFINHAMLINIYDVSVFSLA